MRCPHCDAIEDKVIESRQNAGGTAIRRRRECLACGFRFTSYERIEEKPLMIIKRDGRREPFDIDKLERKIELSLTKRPVSRDEVDQMLQEIEDRANMQSRGTHELSSRDLGEIVLRALFEIDRVAYVRFASVYRMYENVEEFIREIESLSKKALSEGERRQLQFHWEGNK